MALLTTAMPILGDGAGLYGATVASSTAKSKIPNPYKKPKKADHGTGTADDSKTSIPTMVVTILITLVIFVVIVSYYDLLKERIVYNHARTISRNNNVAPTPDEAAKIVTIAEESYYATIDFAVIVTLIALIVLPLLFYMYSRL